ncbi:unnamed protein product [Gordionus sp. m RMFG-2023]
MAEASEKILQPLRPKYMIATELKLIKGVNRERIKLIIAYRYLKSHFCMPSESTLRAWSSKIEIMPGFLSISFTQIKSYQKKSEKQLYCQYNLIINKSCDDRIKKDECL